MKIWGISDLHLSFAFPKPMDVFGEHWRDHAARIEESWRKTVGPEDLVCLPGDLSWAMRLTQAEDELRWLGALPGRKILVKGNHDYWWESASKVRKALPAGVHALQNDALLLEGAAIGGARGWIDPALSFGSLSADESLEAAAGREPMRGILGPEEDERIYRRELERLETSLRRMDPRAKLRLALLHFPPTSPELEETPVTRLLEKYRVDAVAFGHLHGGGWARFENPFGIRGGVRYYLVSADFAHFRPIRIAEVPRAPGLAPPEA